MKRSALVEIVMAAAVFVVAAERRIIVGTPDLGSLMD